MQVHMQHRLLKVRYCIYLGKISFAEQTTVRIPRFPESRVPYKARRYRRISYRTKPETKPDLEV